MNTEPTLTETTTGENVNENLQTSTPATPTAEAVKNESEIVGNSLQPQTNENAPPQEANNNDAGINEDEFVVKKSNRVAYTCQLSLDEDVHVQTIINDLIKFGVVENKADFIRKAIDVYCNYNNVCSENKLEQPLVLPVPDGKNDSVALQPKLLRNSLFKAISKIQSF